MTWWGRPPRKRRARPPREADGGITARKRKGSIGESWWSARFVAVLESFAIGSRLQRGRTYARAGQVLDLRVEPGLVSARVQGTRREPYRVRIGVTTLAESDWARLEKALAAQAVFAARLLAGEMPREIEEVFADLDLSLFPATARDLQTDCSCPDFANPCKHVAATFYILAEAFDADPFMIFAWRGRPRDPLITELRALRGAAAAATQSGGEADAHGLDVQVEPLGDSIGDFWRIDPSFAGPHVAPHATSVPDALLRQLGTPPREIGGQRLFERLASAYHAMVAGAESVAFGEFTAPAEVESNEVAASPRGPTGAAYFVTDMRHFESGDPADLPAAARRMRDFFGAIVLTATSLPPDTTLATVLKCRRRRGGSPCHGRLIVRLTEGSDQIEWSCPDCGEGGALGGWELSMHDLGGRAAPVPADGPIMAVTLPEAMYAVLVKLEFPDVHAEQLVRAARYDAGTIHLVGTEAEFEAVRTQVGNALRLTAVPSRRTRLRRLNDILRP